MKRPALPTHHHPPVPTPGHSDRGSGWVLVQSVLMLAVGALAIFHHPSPIHPAAATSGLLLVALGGWIGILGVRVLGRNRTPFPRPRSGSVLVQSGIYRRIRHPLYTSVILVSFGWSLAWQSWAAALATLLEIPFFLAKARHEERLLQRQFPDYADYARRVPGFLPRWHPPV